LWDRISSILADGIVDEDEQRELFELLQSISGEPLELGEALKPSGFPLCEPPPRLQFEGWEYAFTGTFLFGKRADCESAVRAKGAIVGSVRKTTNVLVIGSYATESWKHSAMGLKILKACELRDAGQRIAIVSEQHWINELTGKV
jgi:NAD-dependent DNA ligase